MKLRQKAFTLIEVVIVLAIGALIILVVLQAVTSAQRNQRNSARRSEASRISSALESYAANNNGTYPADTDFGTFLNNYEPDLAAKGWVRQGAVNTTCGTQDSTSYQLLYTRVNTRDYQLKVCLEPAVSADIRT